MSALFGFVVGYVVGARAGNEGFARLEQAVREIRQSDEFRNFVSLLRSHLQGTIETVNERLKAEGPVLGDIEQLAADARARLRRDDE